MLGHDYTNCQVSGDQGCVLKSRVTLTGLAVKWAPAVVIRTGTAVRESWEGSMFEHVENRPNK